MKDMMRLKAGIISGVIAIVLVLCFYAVLGTVDLVFMKGNNEVARLKDVSVLSDVELTRWDIKNYEELEFTYGEDKKDFADNFDLKVEIGKTVLMNFLTFKWDEQDQVIVLHAK